MDLFARAIEAVRAEVHADRILLVGHSMGTPVVIRYAQLYPRRSSALVFVDGVTAGNPGRQRRTGAMMAGPDGRKNREEMIRGFFSASTTPALQKRIFEMMMAAPEATAAGAMDATLEATRQDQPFSLDLPILAIYSGHSRLASPEYLHPHFHNLEFAEIPDTGHFLMLEKPEEFNRLLLAFLARQRF